jgi:hypothetical protein
MDKVGKCVVLFHRKNQTVLQTARYTTLFATSYIYLG